jgi:hypothetical protein
MPHKSNFRMRANGTKNSDKNTQNGIKKHFARVKLPQRGAFPIR